MLQENTIRDFTIKGLYGIIMKIKKGKTKVLKIL